MTFMPAGDLRRKLRGHGHGLSPIVQVGKSGVTEPFLGQVKQALEDHELIKVKVGAECPVDRHEVADRLNEMPGVNVVQLVGRVVLLYKRHPREPRYEGSRAREGGTLAEGRAPVRRRRPPKDRRASAKTAGKTPGRRTPPEPRR